MDMYFEATTSVQMFFKSWNVTTSAGYAATLLAVVGLCLVEVVVSTIVDMMSSKE